MIEALKDYVIIHTTGENFTIHSTMKDIIKKLPKEHFTRAHRSYIVNVSKITSIKQGNLYINGVDKEIPVGGSYKTLISEQINVL